MKWQPMAVALAAAAFVAASGPSAGAQDYPSRTITFICPFPPGGSTPDELAAFIPAEIAKWSPVVKDAGITQE